MRQFHGTNRRPFWGKNERNKFLSEEKIASFTEDKSPKCSGEYHLLSRVRSIKASTLFRDDCEKGMVFVASV